MPLRINCTASAAITLPMTRVTICTLPYLSNLLRRPSRLIYIVTQTLKYLRVTS